MKFLSTRSRTVWTGTRLAAVTAVTAVATAGLAGSLLTACDSSTPSDGVVGAGGDVEAGEDGEAGGLELPRTVTYAGWTWTVTEATFDAAVGETTAGATSSSSPGAPEARLSLTVTSILEDTTVTFPVGLLALSDADGVSVRGEHFAGPDATDTSAAETTLKIDPMGRADTTAVFEVAEDFSLDGAKLTIAESDVEPAVLPLTGEQPEDPYPIRAEIGAPARQVTAALGELLEFQPVAVTASVDLGSERAPVGKRWLAVDFTLTGVSDSVYAGIFGGDYLDVLVDGEGIAPTDWDRIDVHAGDSRDGTFVYEIPAEFSTLQLIAGDRADPAAKTATFDVDLPALPALPL